MRAESGLFFYNRGMDSGCRVSTSISFQIGVWNYREEEKNQRAGPDSIYKLDSDQLTVLSNEIFESEQLELGSVSGTFLI